MATHDDNENDNDQAAADHDDDHEEYDYVNIDEDEDQGDDNQAAEYDVGDGDDDGVKVLQQTLYLSAQQVFCPQPNAIFHINGLACIHRILELICPRVFFVQPLLLSLIALWLPCNALVCRTRCCISCTCIFSWTRRLFSFTASALVSLSF